MHGTQPLPIHPTKRHPITGEPLQAIWVTPTGRTFWPVIGASGDADADAAAAAAQEAADKAAADTKAAEDTGDTGDKPLGENGEKALKAERDARKALESQLADLKKGLAVAVGITGDDGDKPDLADGIAAVQKQISDLQHANTVLGLANEHKITDKDDLELLAGTKDAAALKKLAARLAPDSNENDAANKAGRPKPDRSQASGGEEGKSSIANGRDLFAARRGKKSA